MKNTSVDVYVVRLFDIAVLESNVYKASCPAVCTHCAVLLMVWRCSVLCRPCLRHLLSGSPHEVEASAARRGPEWETGPQAGTPGAGPKEYHSPRFCHQNDRYQQSGALLQTPRVCVCVCVFGRLFSWRRAHASLPNVCELTNHCSHCRLSRMEHLH